MSYPYDDYQLIFEGFRLRGEKLLINIVSNNDGELFAMNLFKCDSQEETK